MIKNKLKLGVAAVSIAGLLLNAPSASAATFPAKGKTITIIVSGGPAELKNNGATLAKDARIIFEKLGLLLLLFFYYYNFYYCCGK